MMIDSVLHLRAYSVVAIVATVGLLAAALDGLFKAIDFKRAWLHPKRRRRRTGPDPVAALTRAWSGSADPPSEVQTEDVVWAVIGPPLRRSELLCELGPAAGITGTVLGFAMALGSLGSGATTQLYSALSLAMATTFLGGCTLLVGTCTRHMLETLQDLMLVDVRDAYARIVAECNRKKAKEDEPPAEPVPRRSPPQCWCRSEDLLRWGGGV